MELNISSMAFGSPYLFRSTVSFPNSVQVNQYVDLRTYAVGVKLEPTKVDLNGFRKTGKAQQGSFFLFINKSLLLRSFCFVTIINEQL